MYKESQTATSNTGEVTLNSARRQAGRMWGTAHHVWDSEDLIFLEKQAIEDRSQPLNDCPVGAPEGRFLETALEAGTRSVNPSFQQTEVHHAYWQEGSGT